MALLKTQQIDRVVAYLDQHRLGVEFRDELVDQICCELEEAVGRGQAFEEAWLDIQNRWPASNIKKLNNSIQFIKIRPMLIKLTAVVALLASLTWLLPKLAEEAVATADMERLESTEVHSNETIDEIQVAIQSEVKHQETDQMDENLSELREQRMNEMRFMHAVRQDMLKPRVSPLKNVALVDARSGFGMRKHPISGELRMHNGIDLIAPLGTPVYATADGVVVFAGPNGDNGIQVRINHAGGYTTVYNHLDSHEDLVVGQPVFVGAHIARVGSTGLSTGPHLHYEIRKNDEAINPC
ncbi:MAG: M23 family metallopeptidase [Bacteroidota bacterium]